MSRLAQLLARIAAGRANLPSPPVPPPRPTILFTGPAGPINVSPYPLTVILSDSSNVGRVDFFKGTLQIGQTLRAPYTCAAPLTYLDNGEVRFRAVVVDQQGEPREVSFRIDVAIGEPDTTAPVPVLTASATNFTADGTLTLTCAASDNTGVTGLVLTRTSGGQAPLALTIAPDGTFSESITRSSNGTHVYTLTAFDAAGNPGSTSVEVTVKIAAAAPTINLSANSLNFAVAGSLDLTAIASAGAGVKNVIFYWDVIGPNNIIKIEGAVPYEGSRPITSADNGTHTVFAVVTDKSAIPQTAQDSKQVTVNIAPAVQLPTLALDKTSTSTGLPITATLGRLQAGDQLDWGDGTVLEAVNGLTHSYSASGPYTVKVLRGGVSVVSVPVGISTPVIGITYDPPLVITAGGTYQGSWQSVDDLNVPAVLIDTAQPVTLLSSNLRGKGDLIRCRRGGGRVTVRDVSGIGLNPNVAGKKQGRFADFQYLAAFLVENCEIEGTGGVYANAYNGNGTTDTFIVRYVLARNINGRFSDGNGGYQTGAGNFFRYQLVQYNHVKGIPGSRIEWNQTINEPGKSHIEDTVNLSDSEGKSDSDRIIVQRNLCHGAFSLNPADSYSGGGIILCDGGGRFQTAQKNIIIETSNYGIAVADGNDASILDNTILGLGRLADGTYLDADSDAGIYLRMYGSGVRRPESVIASGNVVGWMTPTPSNPNSQWNLSVQTKNGVAQGVASGNTLLTPAEVTQARLDAARQAWLDSVVAANLTVGRLTV